MFISQNLFCLDKTANRDSRSRHNGSQFVTWDKVSACNKCIRGWWYNVNCASGQNSNFNGVYLRGKEGRFHWSYLDLSHPYNSEQQLKWRSDRWNIVVSRPKFVFSPTFIFYSPLNSNNWCSFFVKIYFSFREMNFFVRPLKYANFHREYYPSCMTSCNECTRPTVFLLT